MKLDGINLKSFMISNQNQAHLYRCTTDHFVPLKGKGKGKAIPLQAWTGPEGSRSLRLTDFKTVGTWRR